MNRMCFAFLLLCLPGLSLARGALDVQTSRCIASAAQYYYRPSDPISYRGFVDLIQAIRLTEGGAAGHITRNTNGSFDIGPMQINSSHLPLLQSFGITYASLLYNACENIFVGTWILHSEILTSGSEVWRGIGNYNSRTPIHNRRYQMRVWSNLQTIWANRGQRVR